MSKTSFLSQLGLFVVENFLSAERCQELCEEAFAAYSVPSVTIVTSTDQEVVASDFRRTKTARVSKKTLDELSARLMSIKSDLEAHFEVLLEDYEAPQVLIYREGDFFKLHTDSSDYENERRNDNRKISVVIFLNSQTSEPNEHEYSGGLLSLFGLIGGEEWKDKGISVGGETGLLIAFRSDTMHEVTPIDNGTRLSIVSWFA